MTYPRPRGATPPACRTCNGTGLVFLPFDRNPNRHTDEEECSTCNGSGVDPDDADDVSGADATACLEGHDDA